MFAREQEGGSANAWFAEARATCAYAPAGLERVVATSAASSANKSIVAKCPTGKRLVGTGAETAAGAGQVSIGEVTPDAGLTKVTVKAFEDQNGTAAIWAVTGYAICANPIAGAERVMGFSGQSSDPTRVIEVPCNPGKRVLGSGGSVSSFGYPGEIVLDAMFTNGSSTGAGFAAYEDPSGTTALWHLTVVRDLRSGRRAGRPPERGRFVSRKGRRAPLHERPATARRRLRHRRRRRPGLAVSDRAQGGGLPQRLRSDRGQRRVRVELVPARSLDLLDAAGRGGHGRGDRAAPGRTWRPRASRSRARREPRSSAPAAGSRATPPSSRVSFRSPISRT